MSMNVTFDSSAWIEYFSGMEIGQVVRSYIDSDDLIYTSTISLMEVKSKYQRENKSWKERIKFIAERSTIVEIDDTLALAAADFRIENGLHSIDAIIYATSTLTKSKLVSKDAHFKNLKNVVMLE
ncbi:MAG: PIN domain-containing protein [Euryarchaeota archaeon]|nr:PIN domain-containing protein [Euryarchaeota archaeon]